MYAAGRLEEGPLERGAVRCIKKGKNLPDIAEVPIYHGDVGQSTRDKKIPKWRKPGGKGCASTGST